MRHQPTPTLLAGVAVFTAVAAQAAKQEAIPFRYDPADQTITATLLDDPELYDADIKAGNDGLWLAWLQFVPGSGDHVWVGCRRDSGWIHKQRVTVNPGRYANPTITIDAQGQVWLSYEAELRGQWDVFLAQRGCDNTFADFRPVTSGPGPDIHHRMVAAPAGGLWLVWQGDQGGQFDILARHIDPAVDEIGSAADSPPRHSRESGNPAFVVSQSPARSDWAPDLAITPDKRLVVAWDGYDGTSYNTYLRVCKGSDWGAVTEVTSTPAFEARVRLAADRENRVWLVYEEDAENWGTPYRPRMALKTRDALELNDTRGPLHRFRRLNLAVLEPDGTMNHHVPPLPMPAMEEASRRPEAPTGVKWIGAFYEGARLTVDSHGRVWLVYRHCYAPWMGIVKQGHVEQGSGLYARCLDAAGWSKLFRFEIGQGDGLQRVEVAPQDDGVAVVWTTGRTDRRETKVPQGIVLAAVAMTAGKPPVVTPAGPIAAQRGTSPRPAAQERSRPRPESIAGQSYGLFFGDLHRHTDLSLCFVPCDGTIDDAYRYAIDVAGLNFLGITDHARDIALGNPLSQLWWRSTKEVLRHELKPAFFPMYASERSRAGEDHNAISLRSDMLRPDTMTHPQFWKQCDNDTFTIPHQTGVPPMPASGPAPRGITVDTWKTNDAVHRPLIEVYQGCRDRFIESDVNEVLTRGYLMGFIASSDHLSTSASYAGVWAEQPTRESIFRAMQARRTFAATDKIRMMVKSGDHAMGERFKAKAPESLDIDLDGTAEIALVEVVIDGQTRKTFRPQQRTAHVIYTPDPLAPGLHSIYVRLQQTDANAAWSSPLWLDVPRP